jgi:hypothetical protein
MKEKIKIVLSKMKIIERAFEGTSIKNAISVAITNNTEQDCLYNIYFIKNGTPTLLFYLGNNKVDSNQNKKTILDIIQKTINKADTIIEYYSVDDITDDSEIRAIVTINGNEYKSEFLQLIDEK